MKGPNSTPGKVETNEPINEANSRIVNSFFCNTERHCFTNFETFFGVNVTCIVIELSKNPRNSSIQKLIFQDVEQNQGL